MAAGGGKGGTGGGAGGRAGGGGAGGGGKKSKVPGKNVNHAVDSSDDQAEVSSLVKNKKVKPNSSLDEILTGGSMDHESITP